MNIRRLGRTGLRVSELCLGAMTFGREADQPTSLQMLDRYLEAGGNFIDTADVYGTTPGASEEILGSWLKGRDRTSLVLATKVRFPTGPGPNDFGLSRKHILDGVHASLRRLGTDYIDLYQVHYWDPATPLEETLSTLDRLVHSGKVRYLGASNFKPAQLQKAIDLSRHHGWQPFVCIQPLYNLLDRGIEWDLLPLCQSEGLGVITWAPLRGGWLSGRYQRGMQAPPQGSRIEEADKQNWSERWEIYANERTWMLLDTLFAVARECEHTPPQVAINWLLNRPGVTSPIIGARSLKHLEDNLGAAGWSLTPEQVDRLTQAGDLPAPYPYNL
ncbi:MAG: aldo/keto reductase [Chloroflexi bacterium RBG_16_57_11]|nr:MAG: aldo/keto reductase [Chloroflexi bacterium RBG_16_57_11]